MSWLNDAHTEWHLVNGQYNANCPLDCGAMSPEQREAEDLYNFIAYEDETGTPHIRCGHCPDRHATIEVVRACAQLSGVFANV